MVFSFQIPPINLTCHFHFKAHPQAYAGHSGVIIEMEASQRRDFRLALKWL